ncbi:MC091L [Molluscum contagiosum virus subtype 1]|uniref:B1-44-2 protein n=3 Tax=Molluscum contagiosum virus TaxID=10279 RepID=Q98258_MCV1|nr:MC091L [Molluscum contagiosum virus subtype 1]AZT86302.1 MC091L [Molluscum contagiosum virus]AAB57975.1 similar to variola F2L and vaccinia D2L [Molluscum contagiosum virus subtype 1]AAC55219.1 MC091L [Molluscum contagiosum virus subtype 1]AQY16840.1 MC091 [Molluscum contagiosum virus subtype 1]AQY17019.1 MC091 [Molluscum contagiosum virus subtype 1]
MSVEFSPQQLQNFLARARVFCPQDAARVARARYTVLTYSGATPVRVHVYAGAARFDTLSIYQVVKHVFRDRPDMLRALFPSEQMLESIIPLEPEETLELGALPEERESRVRLEPAGTDTEHAPSELERTKLALLELFNAFRSGAAPGSVPYYYLPLREELEPVPQRARSP